MNADCRRSAPLTASEDDVVDENAVDAYLRGMGLDPEVYIGFCYDDGGRQAAGYVGDSAGDCVTRALCILLHADYRRVYRMFANANASAGHKRTAREGLQPAVWKPIFRALGLQPVKLPRGPRPTFTEAYDRYGDCIVATTRHIAAIVGGYLHDTGDSRLYVWTDPDTRQTEVRERKAQSVWVRPSVPVAGALRRPFGARRRRVF